MEISAEDIMNYHCPRWSELPEIELYIDQVVCILENNLSLFNNNPKVPIITSTMINNYVKHKIINPPKKKKYNRGHLAYLFVICIFKRLMPLADIRESIVMTKRWFSVEEGYNLFCEELENALKHAFAPDKYNIESALNTDIQEVAAMRAIVNAFANSILADRIIAIR